MKDLENFKIQVEKLLIEYTNLFGNLIVDGPVYLDVISNKVTF